MDKEIGYKTLAQWQFPSLLANKVKAKGAGDKIEKNEMG